jgi:hypothetical protein
MNDYSAIVAQALERLGQLRSNDERETEENKARVTRLAAFLIHQQNPNIGLLRKDGGNRSMIKVNGEDIGMSVDLIIDKSDGTFADVASDADDGGGFRRTVIVWVPHPETSSDPAWLGRWIKPTSELAGLGGGGTEQPDPQRPTVPGGELEAFMSEVRAFITENRSTLARLEAALASGRPADPGQPPAATKLVLKGEAKGRMPMLGDVNLPIELREP